MPKEIDCKTGLEAGLVNKETFDKELKMCKKLNKDNGGKCCWGKCDQCGVVPLLFKLHKGKLLERPEEIADEKNKLFS